MRQQVRSQFAAEKKLPARHTAHTASQILEGVVFQHKTAGTGLQGGHDLLQVAVGGKAEQATVQVFRAQPPQSLQPAHAGHGHVDDRDIGFELARQAYQFHAVASLGQHVQIGLPAQ